MTELAEKKQALRQELRENRKSRQPDADYSSRLSQSLGQFCLDQSVQSVAAYFPIEGEPDIREFLEWALKNGIRVILPSVRGNDLHWVQFDGTTEFGELGFEEASGASARLSDATVIFVPALAVDFKGNRLGKGKGYYDRALATVFAGTKKRSKVVAVVFDEELLLDVPAEQHDHPVDAAITASKLLWFQKH